MANREANWAELPEDLLIPIAQRIRCMEDYAAFRAVCTSWRVVATKQNFKGIPLWPHTPCLMLAADVHHYCEFYSLLGDKVVTKIFLPETKGRRCMDAGFGWLFTMGKGRASLVNPCTRDQIEVDLPKPPYHYYHDRPEFWYRGSDSFCQKAVLSSSPCQNPSDFVLMVCKKRGNGYLSFWKPGNKFWTKIITTSWGCVLDVVHYKGQIFFAIDGSRRVWIVDITIRESRMIARLPSFSVPLGRDFMYYITGSLRKLLVVARNQFKRPEEEGPDQFQVMELDLLTRKSTSIQNLGDRALFVGHGASVCIDQASKFPGIKGNHIYFTDGFSGRYRRFADGRETGIYNMSDRIIAPLYKGQSLGHIGSPIWVVPRSSWMSEGVMVFES